MARAAPPEPDPADPLPVRDERRTGRSGAPGGPWGILVVSMVVLGLATGCDGETATPDPEAAVDMGDTPPADMARAEPGDADAAVSQGWIELGTGFRSFAPLEPGQEVPIIAGIQGGFHIWGGFRGAGFDDSDVRLRFWLDLDGVSIARADYSEFGLPVDRADPTVYDYGGVAVVYDENEAVQRTSGQTMTLRVEVESLVDGQVLTDMTEVVPVCCE